MERLSISVVIPAYNEEKRIRKTLRKTIKYLNAGNHDYEIIVVDDGSKDRTAETAKSFKSKRLRVIRLGKNIGKGGAVKKGMLAARKKYVLFSDADLSTPIEELGKFAKLRKKYDVVIASRALKGSNIKVSQPFYRVFMGKVFNIVVNIIGVWGIKDTQCGFKMFSAKSARKIFKKQTFRGFSFDVESLFIAKKLGYRIKEVPVTWINSPATKVSPVKDSLKMFFDVARIRINDILGKY
jgi:dolichyl-phosphate beta-glucosyltransferase